ncbi:glycosyltransferase [Altererythrobacter sp. KTW20L]|uniref:glycosyltransferase family 2 protein n=1 Tax=Altererythrobacter sp. KTW20L TaxID=2942210 RepID=UPI0020C0351F|nr:glycosyltransferase family 2 protein [Altererythrobacter sp. KTW20L]MCL6249531.1 glycosyltransferase [Altererythrobacter sp. KTW20L]
MTPRVTVLMAVFNGEPHLGAALSSLAAQTVSDYELLVIDDGSFDGTPALLASAAAADPRIRVVRNTQNLGLTKSLNVGLALARGTYLARLDADDEAAPRRLQLQADFLDAHPGHVLVGACETVIAADGKQLRVGRGGLGPVPFRYLSRMSPAIAHSSAMVRMSTIRENALTYDEACRTAQDFAFWQTLQSYGDAERLPQQLISLREHGGSISRRLAGEQQQTAINISIGALSRDNAHVDPARLAELATFLFTGEVLKRGRYARLVKTALEIEANFLTQHRSERSERAAIRGLTVNLLLKGLVAASSRGNSKACLIGIHLCLRRPLITLVEGLAIMARRL